MIKADLKTVKAVQNGLVSIKSVYYGNQLVWRKGSAYTTPYNREVEYLLATDSDTYIITDLKINDLSKYDIEIKCWCGAGATMPFGVRDVAGSNTNQFAMLHGANGNYQLRVQSGSSTGSFTANNTNPYVFSWKKTKMYVGNTVMSSPTMSSITTLNSSYGLGLFGCNSGGFVDNTGKDRCIYYLKVWYDDELIMDYIPVVDNNGIPCFWDKVTEKLIRCSGNGTFSFAEKEQQ